MGIDPFNIIRLKEPGTLSIGDKNIEGVTPGSYPLVHAYKPGLHIVLFWMTDDKERNLKAYDDQGHLVWVAEAAWIGLDDSRRVDPYSAMGWDSKWNCITLGTFSGQSAFLNHDSGTVNFGRRPTDSK